MCALEMYPTLNAWYYCVCVCVCVCVCACVCVCVCRPNTGNANRKLVEVFEDLAQEQGIGTYAVHANHTELASISTLYSLL